MNATRQFLGDPAGWKDVRLHLSSMQGLWGGWLITVSGSLEVLIRRVSPATWEARYRFNFDEAEFTAIAQTCIEHNLLTVPAPARPGHPDETMLELTLVNQQGKSQTAHKWAGDHHPDFDAVYRAIFSLTEQIQNATPFHSGPFDWSISSSTEI